MFQLRTLPIQIDRGRIEEFEFKRVQDSSPCIRQLSNHFNSIVKSKLKVSFANQLFVSSVQLKVSHFLHIQQQLLNHFEAAVTVKIKWQRQFSFVWKIIIYGFKFHFEFALTYKGICLVSKAQITFNWRFKLLTWVITINVCKSNINLLFCF